MSKAGIKELDSWGLHVDCVEDCCWEARVERAGGSTEVSGEAVLEAIRDGLLSVTTGADGEIEIEFEFERLWALDRLEPVALAEAEALRLEWAALPTTTRHHRDASGPLQWAHAEAVAVAAFAAGLRSSAEFSSWFGAQFGTSYRPKLIRALLSRGFDPVEVFYGLEGSDGSWQRALTTSEFGRMVRGAGLDWLAIRPFVASGPMGGAA